MTAMPPRSVSVARLLSVLTFTVCAGCGAETERQTVKAPMPGACAGDLAKESNAGHELGKLFDEEWEYAMKDSPTWASELGDLRYNDRWDEISLAAVTRRNDHDREILEKARRIDPKALTDDARLSHELFVRRYALAVEAAPFRFELLPLDHRGGIQTADELADSLRWDEPKSFHDWNARLRAFPTYMAGVLELLREGVRLGITHPKVVMARVPGQIAKQIVTDAAKSPFFAPYAHMPDKIPPAERARLTSEAKREILEHVVPAFQELQQFFATTYLPACKDNVGAWTLPNGKALYAFAVRRHTTTQKTPDEIFALGQSEVLRIRGEMERVKAKAGYTGTMKDFFQFLRTDPRFFKTSREELLVTYRDTAKRVDPNLGKLFGKLPRTPYGVSPIPDVAAPDTTTAYYREPAADGTRGGTYFVNLYKPETRPTWEIPALTMHESVPGHHLQLALANEQTDLPKFRRFGDYTTAYVEGWALYAESLGDEIGMYDDPYAKFGQLTYEMWRAVRLVVDTGIHEKHWSRQEAILYFTENAPKQKLDIENEIDRYITWPGQALAYKMGELTIKELRRKREAAQGPSFDERRFHDQILEHGALPLDILEREMNMRK
jgi:uncharacterized protein (DUF885 family)